MISINPLTIAFLIASATARELSFDIQTADLSKYGGLYQSVYSNKTGKLYVTNAVGRPPVKVSDLIEIDPSTLKILNDLKPAFDSSNNTQRYAVYGIDIDQKKELVWTTNTRQNTVAYYNAKDLSLGNQYPKGIQNHPRDVYVDQKTNLAWVSASTSDVIDVFSPDKKDGTYRRINITQEIGKPFQGVMSLVADEAAQTLYTVSLKSQLAAAIDLKTYKVKTWDLPKNTKTSSGVAWDSKRKHLFIANQGSNNTLVLDPSSGKILKDIAVPSGPLNARYDPIFDVVYVASRTGHAVSVIDPEDYSIIATLNVTVPNHIALGRAGEVFVTDKSNASLLYKFTPHQKDSKGTPAGAAGSSAIKPSGGARSSRPAGNGAAASGSAAKASGSAAAKASGSAAAKASGSAAAKASGSAAASGAAKASGSSAASGKASGSGVRMANAASALTAPITIGAIAGIALLI